MGTYPFSDVSPTIVYNGAISNYISTSGTNRVALGKQIKQPNHINPDDELTDEDSDAYCKSELVGIEYARLFDDNKGQILQVLPNLKVGMDLTKVIEL